MAAVLAQAKKPDVPAASTKNNWDEWVSPQNRDTFELDVLGIEPDAADPFTIPPLPTKEAHDKLIQAGGQWVLGLKLFDILEKMPGALKAAKTYELGDDAAYTAGQAFKEANTALASIYQTADRLKEDAYGLGKASNDLYSQALYGVFAGWRTPVLGNPKVEALRTLLRKEGKSAQETAFCDQLLRDLTVMRRRFDQCAFVVYVETTGNNKAAAALYLKSRGYPVQEPAAPAPVSAKGWDDWAGPNKDTYTYELLVIDPFTIQPQPIKETHDALIRAGGQWKLGLKVLDILNKSPWTLQAKAYKLDGVVYTAKQAYKEWAEAYMLILKTQEHLKQDAYGLGKAPSAAYEEALDDVFGGPDKPALGNPKVEALRTLLRKEGKSAQETAFCKHLIRDITVLRQRFDQCAFVVYVEATGENKAAATLYLKSRRYNVP